MLLRSDTLCVPQGVDLRDELCRWARGRVDPVVVVVKDKRDGERPADGEQIVDVVAQLSISRRVREESKKRREVKDLVIFENEAGFDVIGELAVVLLEAFYCCVLVFECP